MNFQPFTGACRLVACSILIGFPAGSADASGFALQFDGVDDYVNLPTNQDLQLVQTDFTIEAWLYLDQPVSNSRIISGVTSPFGYQVHVVNNRVGADLSSSGGNINFTSNAALTLEVWHHVAVVREDDTVRLFINGQLDSSATNTSMTYVGSVNEIRMGRREGGCCPHDGIIDEVRVWSYARSATAIEADYRMPLSGNEAGLVAYWTFDEGTGQFLVDHTGRGNDGRLGDSTLTDSADPNWIGSTLPSCIDFDGDGYYADSGCGTARDCNDSSATTYPGVMEICDGYDNDCSSVADDSPTCVRVCDASATVYPPRRVPGGENPASQPALAWNGYEYGIAFVKGSNELAHIAFVAVDQLAREIVSASPIASPRSSQPRIVWAGDAYGLVYVQNESTSEVLRFARISQGGAPLGNPHVVGSGMPSLGSPALSWNGSGYGIVWRAENGPLSTVYFRSHSPDGAALTSIVALSDPSSSCGQPSIDWTGVDYGIIWGCQGGSQSSNGIWFARVSSTGLVLSAPVRLSDCANFGVGQLASSGAGFGVTWISNDGRVMFTTVDLQGLALSPIIEVAPYYTDSLSMAWTGEEFVVSWHDRRLGDNLDHVYYRRVSADGTSPAPDVRLTSAMREDTYPRLGWNGQDFGLVILGSYPGGLCSGQCDIHFARIGCGCQNADGDGFALCRSNLGGDCSDGDPTTYPDAPQLCDARNNNCADPTWPTIPPNEVDGDGDTTPSCNDCNDSNPAVHPGAPETCNAVDDNCNVQVDEDASGVDSDNDSIHNACDNCRFAFNPDQLDADGDLIGSSCDNCVVVANPGQQDLDADQRGDACDNCQAAYNPFQDDFDTDRRGDACDNCVFDFNPPQSDFDQDGQGDFCDVNDGLIYVFSTDDNYVEWQAESGPSSWNVYEGDLGVLKASGVYTQATGSNPLAQRTCGVADPYLEDFDVPPTAAVKFSLVAGVTVGVEGSLGTSSAGATRPNTNPCP